VLYCIEKQVLAPVIAHHLGIYTQKSTHVVLGNHVQDQTFLWLRLHGYRNHMRSH